MPKLLAVLLQHKKTTIKDGKSLNVMSLKDLQDKISQDSGKDIF